MTVHYQPHGASWKTLTASGSGDTYTATIPAADVIPGTLAYFIQAKDTKSNTSLTPAQDQAAPFNLTIVRPEKPKEEPKGASGGCRTGRTGDPVAILLTVLLVILFLTRKRRV